MTTKTLQGCVLHFDDGLDAHVMDDREVPEGAELELLLADGHWAKGWYTRRPGTKRQADFTLALGGGEHLEARARIPELARLRFPRSSR